MVIELVSEARAQRLRRRRESPHARWFEVLDEVKDPEVPVLSLWELGVLYDVTERSGTVVVTLTPTYSGCPAIEVMEADAKRALLKAGATDVVIQRRLSPAWTTDWLSRDARAKLRTYGIAPPGATVCPQCGSSDVQVVSEFGSTACKALYRCRACAEPFDQFKAI